MDEKGQQVIFTNLVLNIEFKLAQQASTIQDIWLKLN